MDEEVAHEMSLVNAGDVGGEEFVFWVSGWRQKKFDVLALGQVSKPVDVRTSKVAEVDKHVIVVDFGTQYLDESVAGLFVEPLHEAYSTSVFA